MTLRGAVLAEDRRTERFVRALLVDLGFNTRRFRFTTAPSGSGDAKAWVRAQYPNEVRLLRQKNYQRLGLIAVRDGDNVGVERGKSDLDDALREAAIEKRGADQRISTPVPTWSIETWLLVLLGEEDVDESSSFKEQFEKRYGGKDEGRAIRSAAKEWRTASAPSAPSLEDGREELQRLDLP